MKIKDLQSGNIFEYGGCHDSLAISQDGRTLSYYNLQNGDGSKYGDYRFVMEDGEVPADSKTPDAIHAECYFDIGGRFDGLYAKGRADAINEVIKCLKAQFLMQNNLNSEFVETIVLHRDFIDALEQLKEQK